MRYSLRDWGVMGLFLANRNTKSAFNEGSRGHGISGKFCSSCNSNIAMLKTRKSRQKKTHGQAFFCNARRVLSFIVGFLSMLVRNSRPFSSNNTSRACAILPTDGDTSSQLQTPFFSCLSSSTVNHPSHLSNYSLSQLHYPCTQSLYYRALLLYNVSLEAKFMIHNSTSIQRDICLTESEAPLRAIGAPKRPARELLCLLE